MPDEVSLFSGGLDSFAGALDAATRGDRIALVTAASATKLDPARKALVRKLHEMTGQGRVQHVPVSLQLGGGFQERTHRTRSFIYAALGVVTATLFGLDRARFYENGVVSLNLPSSAQVIGARATRSTHPQTLAALGRLFSLVFERPIRIDNPFIWKTKTEVISLIAALGASAMIRHTRSCAEVYNRTVMHPHCGRCSQCIDRRFAMLAAGIENEDPGEAYEIDPVHGPRPDVRDRELALGYVRNGRRCATMTPAEFFASFGEAQRALAFFDEPPDAAAERLYLLHRRHGEAVRAVADGLIRRAMDALPELRPDPDSLLALVGRDVFGGSVAEVAAGPASLAGRKQAIPSSAVLPVVIDRRRRSVRLGTLGEISGVGFQLIDELANAHLASAGAGHAPEDHAFTQARGLADSLGVDEETIRKRIQKIRRQIEKLALAAGADPPTPSAVIENSPWRGYRLNPTQARVEVVTSMANRASATISRGRTAKERPHPAPSSGR